MHEALSKGNAWAQTASMIIAVFGKQDEDCEIGPRIYYLFDIGMATGFLILRATELGMVAHPIAGYNEDKVKDILNIPDEMRIITLVIVGKRSDSISDVLSEKQVEQETHRPPRKKLNDFVYNNQYMAD